MLKLQNIYPFTKSQGLDKCFLPFIIYVHKQCDLHLFLVSLHFILKHCLHLLHTGVYQNWSVRGCNSRLLYVILHNIYSSDIFAVFSALLTQYCIQRKFEWEKSKKKKNKIRNILPNMWSFTFPMWFFSKRQELSCLIIGFHICSWHKLIIFFTKMKVLIYYQFIFLFVLLLILERWHNEPYLTAGISKYPTAVSIDICIKV